MEESQESKDVIIPLLMLMNMPEETICELFRTEKTRPAISVGLRLFIVEDAFMEYSEMPLTKQKGTINPFWEIKHDTKIIHIKLREIHTPASEAAYQNSEMTLVLRRP